MKGPLRPIGTLRLLPQRSLEGDIGSYMDYMGLFGVWFGLGSSLNHFLWALSRSSGFLKGEF